MRPIKTYSVLKQLSAVFLIILVGVSIPMTIDGKGPELSLNNDPPTREGEPLVNLSQVDIELHEGYGELVGQYFNATGYGTYDLFYDPNYDWDEVPYPKKAFEVQYPDGYDEDSTPVKVDVNYDTFDTSFGRATITENKANWNNLIYGQDWYVVSVIARNGNGSVEAQVRFKVHDVNDRPRVISGRDYFSIAMDEDTEFVGVNSDHDAPNMIFGDDRDPFDVLTYECNPHNDLAQNVTVEIEEDGSFIKFIPEEDWACPYVPRQQRLKSSNPNFCLFMINCSDDGGLYVPENEQLLRVYVAPVNDPPTIEEMEQVTYQQDELVHIEINATDLDLEWEQELVYGTNITTSIYEITQEQIEFQEEFVWDKEEGLVEFMSNNELVGSYDVSAYVQDKPTESGRPDYPATPYRTWSNFTLTIENLNDGPRARLDQPVSTFLYNTTSLIEFDARRSSDIDIQHGDVLNYTWTANGDVIGYGKQIHRTLDDEGIYNITVNVTDQAGEYSLDWVDIEVVKARIPGEIFKGKEIDREYTDNNTAVVISRTTEELEIFRGGENSLDIVSVVGERKGAVYQVRVDFAEKLDPYFTDEIEQYPVLELFFLKSDFTEQAVEISPQNAIDFRYPQPPSNVRYKRLEFDLLGPSATEPKSIIPLDTIRKLDNEMGVVITLTVIEMDELGIKPDFELYAVATMDTKIKDVNGNLLESFESWDSSGYNTVEPEISGSQEDGNGNGDGDGEGPGALLWVILAVILVIIVAAVVVVVLLASKNKKGSAEPEPMPTQPEQTVDDMVFGDDAQTETQYPDAQQMYGQPQQQQLQPASQEGTVSGGNLPPASSTGQADQASPQQQTATAGEQAPGQERQVDLTRVPGEQTGENSTEHPSPQQAQVQYPPQQ